MNIEQISAQIEIRNLMTTYCRGVDRGDREMILSVYHDDGWDERGTTRLPAKEFVQQLVDGMDARGQNGQHHVTNVYIELDGNHARSESYIISFSPDRDNPGRTIMIAGRYLDRLEHRNGLWKISERQCILDYVEPQPDGTPWSRWDLFKHGQRGIGDPSYAFFAVGSNPR